MVVWISLEPSPKPKAVTVIPPPVATPAQVTIHAEHMNGPVPISQYSQEPEPIYIQPIPANAPSVQHVHIYTADRAGDSRDYTYDEYSGQNMSGLRPEDRGVPNGATRYRVSKFGEESIDPDAYTNRSVKPPTTSRQFVQLANGRIVPATVNRSGQVVEETTNPPKIATRSVRPGQGVPVGVPLIVDQYGNYQVAR